MDRRVLAIIAVIACEVIFRAGYTVHTFAVSPLTYTLLARLAELALILSLAFHSCGMKTLSLKKELLIGLGISFIFGSVIIIMDLASRLFIKGGLLKVLLVRQEVPAPFLFLLTGCIIAPFVEELFFRGLFYSKIRERLPAVVSVMFSALAFASLHGFLSPVQLTGGILFAVLFEWRRNIWAPSIVHMLANLGIWIVPWIYPLWT